MIKGAVSVESGVITATEADTLIIHKNAVLHRATKADSLGMYGYLINVNTNGNYIQIYHLNNNYSTDGSTGTHAYVGGVVLNNYSLSAENTEYYVKIEGNTLYVNTVERQQAGTKVLATVDLTKGGPLK